MNCLFTRAARTGCCALLLAVAATSHSQTMSPGFQEPLYRPDSRMTDRSGVSQNPFRNAPGTFGSSADLSYRRPSIAARPASSENQSDPFETPRVATAGTSVGSATARPGITRGGASTASQVVHASKATPAPRQATGPALATFHGAPNSAAAEAAFRRTTTGTAPQASARQIPARRAGTGARVTAHVASPALYRANTAPNSAAARLSRADLPSVGELPPPMPVPSEPHRGGPAALHGPAGAEFYPEAYPGYGCECGGQCSCGGGADCGCGMGYYDPTCGLEPSCAYEPTCGCGSAGCDNCAAACDMCEIIALSVPIPHDVQLFGGVQAFKGPLDAGRDRGNFGIHEGFNLGGPLPVGLEPGLGYQIGYQLTHSQLHGSEQGSTSDAHTQQFFTAGFFRRAPSCGGCQYGVVWDGLRDERNTSQDFHQVRAEWSLVNPFGREIGVTTAINTNESTSTGTTYRSLDQYLLFYRINAKRGGQARFFGGFDDDSKGIVGADMLLPVTESLSVRSSFAYIIPEDDAAGAGATEEAWNLSIGLAWHWKGGARRCNPFQPLFNVADNGTLVIDDR